ncbi:hypothetical protein B7P43_G02085 [Cryptotermes secundus]|uniref:Gustatory receptor n=1 Tax=Cryptotermes secundus TaxID=105785 RepID=A0A2J7QQW6_9NEOP|nr:hypothetical protein B7P43_G02085 [Cryptotermes secundus]
MLALFVHILFFKFFRLSPNLAASYLIVFAFQKISLLGSCIAFILLGATTNRSNIRKIMEMLSTVDELLIRNSARNIYKEEFYSLISQVLFLIGLLIGTLYYYVSISSNFQNILFGVYYVLTVLINGVGLLHVLFLLRIMKFSFKRIDEELKMLQTNSNVTTTFFVFRNILRVNPGNDKPACSILALRSMHFNIYELGRLVNSCYGPLMLIEIAHNFVSMVSLVDIVLILLDRRGTIATTIVYYGCWLVYYALKTTALMLTSQMACDESRKILATVHKLLLRPNLRPCCERQLHLFMKQAINNRTVFTASGIFPLDLPTLHSIVSAAVTYSIVFGQLRKG